MNTTNKLVTENTPRNQLVSLDELVATQGGSVSLNRESAPPTMKGTDTGAPVLEIEPSEKQAMDVSLLCDRPLRLLVE